MSNLFCERKPSGSVWLLVVVLGGFGGNDAAQLL